MLHNTRRPVLSYLLLHFLERDKKKYKKDNMAEMTVFVLYREASHYRPRLMKRRPAGCGRQVYWGGKRCSNGPTSSRDV